MATHWPFEDAEATVSISLRSIVEHGAAILFVTREADDGVWQFMDGSEYPRETDARVLSLRHVVEIDPSIEQIADLPRGWCAWREAPDAPWQTAPQG